MIKKTTLFQEPLLVKDIQDISKFNSSRGNCGVNIFVLIYAISMASTMLENLNSKKVGYDFLKKSRDTKRNIILYF
jgi:hypothetical protein